MLTVFTSTKPLDSAAHDSPKDSSLITVTMALFSSAPPPHFPSLSSSSSSKPHLSHKLNLSFLPKKPHNLSVLVPARVVDEGSGLASAAVTVELEKAQEKASEAPVADVEPSVKDWNSNGSPPSPAAVSVAEEGVAPPGMVSKFQDPRWVGGTWDLKQFQIDGKTNWDAVIDAGEHFFTLYPFLLTVIYD